MAATCVRSLGVVVRSSLRGAVVSSNVIQRLAVKRPHDMFTWSRLKFLHSQSSEPASAVLTRSSRCNWRWLVAMATAGFCQGFLGFSFGKKDEEKNRDPLKQVYIEAKEAHGKQDFHKAEILYHDALRVADEMLKLKKINLKTFLYAKTNIYDSLADMALGQGELEKAERLYKETMKGCLQQGLPQEENAIVELSLKLATIYAMMDRKAEAEQGLLYCVKTQDAKLAAGKSEKASLPVPDAVKEATASAAAEGSSGASPEGNNADLQLDEEETKRDTEALLGMALETYGRFLMGQRRLTEAVEALERALSIAGQVLGTDKGQYIILVNDLATAHILLKNYDKAVDILSKAIDSASKTKSPHLPVLYCNLGAAFLRTSKLREAEEACLKGQLLSQHSQHSLAASMSQKCLEKIAQVKKAAA